MRNRGRYVVGGAVVAAVALVAATLWFAPWRLFTDVEVHEALPSAAATSSPVPPGAGGSPSPAASPERTTLATGELISHEHETRGSVRVLALADGSRVLRLDGLDTSDGPDLRVWLTDAPVLEGEAGWHVFDDGAYVELGGLKGNKGDQNYPIPPEVDLSDLTSVSIWCVRFAVSFGAAELIPA